MPRGHREFQGVEGSRFDDDEDMCSLPVYEDFGDRDHCHSCESSKHTDSRVPSVVAWKVDEYLSSSPNGSSLQDVPYADEETKSDSDDDSFAERIQSTIESTFCSELRRHSLDVGASERKSTVQATEHPYQDETPICAPSRFVDIDSLGIVRNLLGMNRRPSITRLKAITNAHKEIFRQIAISPASSDHDGGDAKVQARPSNVFPNVNRTFSKKSSSFTSAGQSGAYSAVATNASQKRLLESVSSSSSLSHKKMRMSNSSESCSDQYSSLVTLMKREKSTSIVSPTLSLEDKKGDQHHQHNHRGPKVTSSHYLGRDECFRDNNKTHASTTSLTKFNSATSDSTRHPVHPRLNNVLFGRGGHAINHEGNKRFRNDILSLRKLYRSSRKGAKQKLAEEVVTRVYNRGGRMLKRQGAFWHQVERKVARNKASQCLRETRYPPCPEDEDAAYDTSAGP